MQQLTITRRLEFDAGHRIPNHGGQCRHLHGHRYAIELTVQGPVHESRGQADDGMVIDFGDIKRIALTHLVEPWDHAFLVAKQDTLLLNLVALWKQEVRQPHKTHPSIARPAFSESWKTFMAMPQVKRFLIMLGLGTIAFSIQDVIL